MAFPLNPSNGQQATVSGVVYTYSTAIGAWTVLTTTSANINVGNITATSSVSGTTGSFTNVSGTLTTAAQTNITSVGTLTSLTVTGNISSDYILGNAAFMSGIPASYTNSNVTSLLASFGSNVISGTGNITGGNIIGTTGTFTNVGGTLTTAAQTNITSVGTLSSLTVTGTVTGGNLTTAGALSAATITETSSRDLKTNFRKVEGALNTVLKLSAWIYDRKDGSEIDELGMVAEDVDPVIRNIVMYDDLGKPIGIKYTRVGVLCIEAIKDLHTEIQELKQLINK